MNQDELLEKIGKVIDARLEPVKRDIQGIKQDVEAVKKGMEGVKRDVEHVRQDVQGVTQDVEGMKGQLGALSQSQARILTVTEALAAGQEEQATKQDIQDLDAKVMKKVKSHVRRINTIEDELDIPHPEQH